MRRRRIRRRRGYWKALAFHITGAAIHERGDELRRHRASVIVSERSVADFVEVRCAFKGAIEFAPTGAETGLVGKGVSDSDSRRKVVIASGRQSAWHVRITGENPSHRRTRKHERLLSGDEGFDFVVLFRPRAAHIPAQTVVDGKLGPHAPAILSEGA